VRKKKWETKNGMSVFIASIIHRTAQKQMDMPFLSSQLIIRHWTAQKKMETPFYFID